MTMNFWERWLNEHPIVGFFLNHPILGIVSLIILISLTGYLLQQLPRVIVSFLWWLLRLPWWLVGLFFNRQEGEKEMGKTIGEMAAGGESQQELMKRIIKKLEEIEEKQVKILEAVLREKK